MVRGTEDPWAVYLRTVVRIEDSGAPISVQSAPPGVTGPWPWPSADPLFILTAWDPGRARPGAEANRLHQARLEEDLRPMAGRMWRAHGLDPATGARDEGVALRGLAEETVRSIGARYGQDAFFSWSPDEWAIVACDGATRLVTGWALGPRHDAH